MNENLSLGRIAGIHVGLNWSVLVVGALIAWSLAVGSLPYAVPGQGAAAYWIAGVLASVLFLASLLAHELAHSIVAQRMGVRVQGITLWLFGGVSRLDSEANSPRSEAVITFVGPLTSLILGALFLIASLGLGSGPTPSLVAATCSWLGTINFILGFFNLIPAAPLDGGRLLHALIWARTGDSLRATTIASRVGMGFGILLIAYGLVTFLVTGNLFNGVWSGFLGWFLLSAARAEESSGLIRQALAGVHVAEAYVTRSISMALLGGGAGAAGGFKTGGAAGAIVVGAIGLVLGNLIRTHIPIYRAEYSPYYGWQLVPVQQVDPRYLQFGLA